MAKIAVLGYGTVGSGVVEVLETNKNSIEKRAGEGIEVKYVLDLRDFPGDPVQEKIVHDVDIIIQDKEIDVVVEVTEQYIFLSPRTGKPYSLEYINRLLKVFKVRYRLPIRAFSTHTFRKAFGRYVYELMGRSAEGLILLNQIFRHSNLETTRRYIGLAQEDIDKVFDSIRL